MNNPFENGIAIIGMAGRFPGAKNLNDFWQNLLNGRDTISRFSDEQLREAGIEESLIQNPYYVKSAGILDEIDQFDASFFGMTPYEAAITDPQHRVFLEVCWEALEVSGYSHRKNDCLIGVFAGMSDSTYLQHCLLKNKEFLASHYPYQAHIATSGNFLATKVSYHLDLTGPSLNINTACSTSLVTIITGCQSLLTGECDMAMAGGISMRIPQIQGYLYQEGGILSQDGQCRAFDKAANGTVSSSGVGVVVLKRLSDALRDNDNIDAVIKGYAMNNDGAKKVGYTAPSLLEQSRCVASALTSIDPESIGYVEAHGTGTALGDPIEIAALTKAFQHYTPKKNYCAIGSVKTNIGHANTAAGIAGLIKTVLILKNRMIPPTLYFQEANPHINFSDSPFYVNNTLLSWEKNDLPRHAGVSSFGIGGTNTHIVLEEAHKYQITPTNSYQRIPLSICLFKKKRYWIDPDVSITKNTVAITPETNVLNCFYQTSWHRLESLEILQTIDLSECKNTYWLIFACDDTFSHQLVKSLNSLGADVTCIYQGDCFQERANNQYTVNPKEFAHYTQLLTSIFKTMDKACHVIHLWGMDGKSSSDDLNSMSETLYQGLYSITFFVQALGTLLIANKLNILLVHDFLQSVFSEETVCPSKATVLGACQVIPLEYEFVQVTSLDVIKNDLSDEKLIHCLILEALKMSTQTEVKQLAYRFGYCWGKNFQSLGVRAGLNKQTVKTPLIFKDQGVYLITGGLGGIGLSITKQLATMTSASIVLIARTVIPESKDWETWLAHHTSAHPHYAVINTLFFLKAQGASISVYAADVASYVQMSKVVSSIQSEIGIIQGIIHAAGVPGFGLIQKKNSEDIDKVLRPKILGTYVLSQLFKTKPLDFVMFFSSLTALTGSIGQLDYAAANASLDAFPYAHCFHDKTQVTTINWNGWLEAGMFAEALKVSENLGRDLKGFNKNNTLVAEEGMLCLAFSIEKKLKNLIISRFKLDVLIQDKLKNKLSSVISHPAIRKGNTENKETLEEKIVSIFKRVLGVEKINLEDDFFYLGGDSLSALNLIDILEKQCGARLSLNQLYDMTTPLQLAKFIDQSTCKKPKSPIVLLNPEGNIPTLFLVHPVGGTIFCYIALSHQLKNQKIAAIQDPGLMQSGYPFDTLEAMAGYYLSEIQKIQPKGPYYVGGYSMGGTLAFEIAHQCLRSGEEVAFLGLLDSWASFTDHFQDKVFFEKKMRHHLEDTERKLKPFLGDHIDDWLASQWQRMQLLLQYSPSILDCKITLFKAQTLLPEYIVIDDPYNHWQSYSQYPMDAFYVSGDHDTLFSVSNIASLSEKLLKCLTHIKTKEVATHV